MNKTIKSFARCLLILAILGATFIFVISQLNFSPSGVATANTNNLESSYKTYNLGDDNPDIESTDFWDYFGLPKVGESFEGDISKNSKLTTVERSEDTTPVFDGGITPISRSSNSITYSAEGEDRIIELYYYLSPYPPYFLSPPTYFNSCAPTAGINAIAYFDRFHTSLIPDFSPGYSFSSAYLYGGGYNVSTPFNTVFSDLYSRMNTNVGHAGTTESDAMSGLSEYVTSKSKTLTADKFVDGSFYYGVNVQNKLIAGQPIILFTKNANYATFVKNNDKKYTYTVESRNANHVYFITGFEVHAFVNNAEEVTHYEFLMFGSTGQGTGKSYFTDNGLYGVEVHSMHSLTVT